MKKLELIFCSTVIQQIFNHVTWKIKIIILYQQIINILIEFYIFLYGFTPQWNKSIPLEK